MSDLNYYRTLIAVADDCPVDAAIAPEPGRRGPTIAELQYGMLADSPHRFTQEDVLFETWLRRQDLSDDGAGEMPDEERARLRARFFAKPQACLRSSPLPKRYGWGLVFDADGRVALCPRESEEYRRLASGADPDVEVLKALRSSRR